MFDLSFKHRMLSTAILNFFRPVIILAYCILSSFTENVTHPIFRRQRGLTMPTSIAQKWKLLTWARS